jgi:hypothetical protein
LAADGYKRLSTISGKCFSERLVSDHEAPPLQCAVTITLLAELATLFRPGHPIPDGHDRRCHLFSAVSTLGCASPRNGIYRFCQPRGEVAQALRLAFIDGSVM